MSDDEQRVISPRVEKVVDFYGDNIPAAQDEAGKVFVPLRQLCDNIGVDFSGQRQRIGRDPVLSTKLQQVEMHAGDGRLLVLMCLPIEMIPGWLFGIASSRTKPEL